MPQEFFVLRCFSCLFFQVQQVKKKPKWQCKVCSAKQSVKKVYGRGSGKECRHVVQSLNRTAGEQEQAQAEEEKDFRSTDEGNGWLASASELPSPYHDEMRDEQPPVSKWEQFREEDAGNITKEDEGDNDLGLGIPSDLLTTERPVHARRKRGFLKNADSHDSSRKQRKMEPAWESSRSSTYNAPKQAPLSSHEQDYTDEYSSSSTTQSGNSGAAWSTSRVAQQQTTRHDSYRYQAKDTVAGRSSECQNPADDNSDCKRGFQFNAKCNPEQILSSRSNGTNPKFGSSGSRAPSSSKWSKFTDYGQEDDEEDSEQEFKTVTENYVTRDSGYDVYPHVEREQPLLDRTDSVAQTVQDFEVTENVSSRCYFGVNQDVDRTHLLQDTFVGETALDSGREKANSWNDLHQDEDRTDSLQDPIDTYSHHFQQNLRTEVPVNDSLCNVEQGRRISDPGSVCDGSHLSMQATSAERTTNKSGKAITFVKHHQAAATSSRSKDTLAQNVLREADNSLASRPLKNAVLMNEHEHQHGTALFHLPAEELEDLPDDFDVW